MTTTKYINISNNQAIASTDIPEHNYDLFASGNLELMSGNPARHCVNYFGYRVADKIKLICCIADDDLHQILVSSSLVDSSMELASFTAQNHNFEKFEREIHENFGIGYIDHPWLKPLRYACNRTDKDQRIENYPFYEVDSEELHEVGVGPIHAGIIEPGHFRFICNGEQIMHLEIQLGYQHRGVEQLFLQKEKLLERTTLAENIVGDTVVGHTTAFVNLWESLCGYTPDYSLHYARTLALELERLANHTGDLSGVCADIAYQLGNSVYGRLRTPIVNFFQEWGGNRLAKGLIRAGKINFPFTNEHAKRLVEVFEAYEPDFNEITRKLFNLPSALSRMEKTGVVSYEEVLEIGTVGMAARMSGLNRDIRSSHPNNLYGNIDHKPIIKHHGDVYSRVQIRKTEIKQSIGYIKGLLQEVPEFKKPEDFVLTPQKEKFAISLVEGWRGEICHCAITDEAGNLKIYKIKDPSFHNWMALSQSVRNNDISDFPICNKSFSLSYCGHDL
ncbi:MAG: NADH dehydrogenase subunit [Bacteroidia bacterium]|nr:NADH dehydrogenase subunit [Bacteroidia bacterium]